MNTKPKALYIRRDHSREPLKKRIVSTWRHFAYYTGQEGFFEEALASQFDVTEQTAEAFLKSGKNAQGYDAVVVNFKCDHKAIASDRYEAMRIIAEGVSVPTVLFIGLDRAAHMPVNEVLDQYDVVVKREPFIDRDRYSLSESNKHKIIASMLSCPLLRREKTPIVKPITWLTNQRQTAQENEAYKYDVFFSGAVTRENDVRPDVWRRVLEEPDINAYGGLQPSASRDRLPDPELEFGKLTPQEFIDTIHRSKINLALDGIGEFTYRHNELWHLGAFMISSPSFRDLEIPLPAKEDVHYVSYNNLDELIEKIHYYLEHDAERNKIAHAGKEMFDQYYNPKSHGRDIKQAVDQLRISGE
ncbi:MAG: glycosyltransferase [Candidatus Paceibacterota bacterium]